MYIYIMSKKDYLKGDLPNDINIRAEIDAELDNFDMKNEDETYGDKIFSTNDFEKKIKKFNPNQLTQDGFIAIIASRRTGKSCLCESLIHEYRKKHKVDAVFLYSKTGAGFYQIPQSFRFRSLDTLHELINTQIKVKKFNQKQKSDKSKISSKVIVIIDDMIDGSNGLRNSKLLTKLSTMGRHIAYKKEHNDLEGNGIMTILISQIYTGLNPTMRQNCDWVFFSKTANREQRRRFVEENLTLNTGKNGLKEAYNLFDVVNNEDYRFLAINTTHSNKYDYDDYVYTYKAKINLPKEKWSGNADDWKNNKINIEW